MDAHSRVLVGFIQAKVKAQTQKPRHCVGPQRRVSRDTGQRADWQSQGPVAGDRLQGSCFE